jgi:hypothetical protein
MSEVAFDTVSGDAVALDPLVVDRDPTRYADIDVGGAAHDDLLEPSSPLGRVGFDRQCLPQRVDTGVAVVAGVYAAFMRRGSLTV